MRLRPIARCRSRRAATTTTPSRSSCHDCSRRWTRCSRASADAMHDLAAFLLQMRHELRNPVNAILGYSQLLLEEADGDALSPRARSDVAHVEQAGRQLLLVINELLDPVHAVDPSPRR